MTTEKERLIRSLIEQQKKFIDLERNENVTVQDYFAPGSDHPLADYAKEQTEVAKKLTDLAHEEKGSSR